MSNETTTALPDVRCHMQYLGVLTLLGKLAAKVPENSVERYPLERAFSDANNYLLAVGSEVRYARTSSGGWGAFDKAQITDAEMLPKMFPATGGA